MKYYIATRLENHREHNKLRDMLNELGHTITYDWTKRGPVWRSGKAVIRETARAEMEGVVTADAVIVLLPGGRGTHVELGMAVALSIPTVIWAGKDHGNLFEALPETCAFYHSDNVIPIVGDLAEVARYFSRG